MTTQLVTWDTVYADDIDDAMRHVTDADVRDTSDMEYACSRVCLVDFMDRTYGNAWVPSDVDGLRAMILGVSAAFDGTRPTFTRVSWGGWPAPSWPDYTVRCCGCGDVMHEGSDQ